MIQRNSRESVAGDIHELEEQVRLRMAAVRLLDVPASNRILLKCMETAKRLAGTVEGRDAVEVLLNDRRASIRCQAASAVMEWDPGKAIPIFGRLLFEALPELSAGERLDLRVTASQWLFKHFGIRNADRNALIEPLRAYGIELPYKDRPWER